MILGRYEKESLAIPEAVADISAAMVLLIKAISTYKKTGKNRILHFCGLSYSCPFMISVYHETEILSREGLM